MDSDELHRHSYACRRDDSTDEEFDFDFSFAPRDPGSSPQIPADQIFKDGKIRPTYPVFAERPKTRNPLGKLFTEEKVTTAAVEPPIEGRWGKSTSAGGNSNSNSNSSSKKWKLKNLMSRSQSVGSKGGVINSAARKKEDEKRGGGETRASGGRVRPAASGGGEKPRSYLPYRLHLVGLFGNGNGNGNGMRKNTK